MAERKGRFLPIALACMVLAFLGGFILMLTAVGKANILYRFALPWELCGAALYLAAWAPAILLVASALAMEGNQAMDGFVGAATRALAPALILAGALSIFYILVIPGIRERKTWYENSSTLFNDSLAEARHALENGRVKDAERFLLVCRAIDGKDERYVLLYDEVQVAFVRAAEAAEGVVPETAEPGSDPLWKAANRFYLEALQARAEGRFLDAHYLAKRSAALYPLRADVRRLVEETWKDLQRLGPSAEELAASAFYKRKLEGYQKLQEKDYLGAFRLFTELSQDDHADQDVQNYLELSKRGLETVAFFIEEDERAFGRSDQGAFSMESDSGQGLWRLKATRCAISDDGVFFRDLVLERTGKDALKVEVPFARLAGDVMTLRAVDRTKPDMVWEPIYQAGAPGELGPFAIRLPLDEGDVMDFLRLSGPVADIPLGLLATGMGQAERFRLDKAPLLAELGLRVAYPFVTMMLILIGAGLGIRFKAVSPPKALATYASAPFFVALTIAPLRAAAGAGHFIVRFLATSFTKPFFPAWIGFLALCTAISVLLAAKVAMNAPR